MTNNLNMRPFITEFSMSIEPNQHQTFRYDKKRQISQILIGEIWVDAINTSISMDNGTRMTKVDQETTDDE